MKILIATDSYKHCLSSKAAGEALKNGLERARVDLMVSIVPVADGGEGTVDALVDATGGSFRTSKVHDPLMRHVKAQWGLLGDGETAVIEMAAASGIELLENDEMDPSATSTFGTGELIRAALDEGCSRIIIGLGGSATNDGGSGMFRALGGQILDRDGNKVGEGGGALADAGDIIFDNLDKRLKQCEIIAASDVSNPLTGEDGASVVYGPQKGADGQLVKQLDKNLDNFAEVVRAVTGKDLSKKPGAGAAGGLGFGLISLLGSEIRPGFEVVAEIVNLSEKIKDADIVFTGEGKLDGQTRFGKTPMGVCRVAREHGKPVIGLAGTLEKGYESLYDEGFTALFSIADRPMTVNESIDRAPELLQMAGFNLGRLITVNFL